MLTLKQRGYDFFNFLTKNITTNKNSYLIERNFKNLRFYIRPLILSDIVMTTETWEPYVNQVFKTKRDFEKYVRQK